MNRRKQPEAWRETQKVLLQLYEGESTNPWYQEYENVKRLASINNPWFTPFQLKTALQGIIRLLDGESIEKWINNYPENQNAPKKIGVIMAGNVPLAGFHDFLCVILSGNHLIAKLSSSDRFLLPFIARIFFSFIPELESGFEISDQLKNTDAIIATGSNNTSRYFEYYFGKKPHIFRKNRNSAAIISGKENEFDFLLLGKDIFLYFGLGCRNVSKLYVPEGYNFDDFFNNMVQFDEVMQHSKYMNNFDYNHAVYLMNGKPFLTNNFLILTEETSLSSPVSVIHYEYYSNEETLNKKLESVKNELQCVVSKKGPLHFGQAQFPSISDYADQVDTMAFLVELSAPKNNY